MRKASKRGGSGFTLVEMLVVLAISAILLAVGVPSFTYMIDRNRVAAEVNEMLADLALARSEALARRSRVIMCRSANPTAANATCTTGAGDWNTGWIVFADNVDVGTPFQRDPADVIEAVVRAFQRNTVQVAITPQITPAGPNKASPDARFTGLTMTADGTVFVLDGSPLASLGAGDPIRIDFEGSEDANKRSICIATTGRARISATFGAC